MRPGFLGFAPARLAGGGFLVLGLVILALGCKGQKKSTDYAEVTGKVYFHGQPLPGGRVNFHLWGEPFSGGGNINEDGSYKVNSPVGEVKISVDNRNLMKRMGPSGSAPTTPPALKRPGSEAPLTARGRYVEIPDKYANPETSGLDWKVEKGGPHQHDIKLE